MASILIVDDSGFSRRQVKKILESLGHSVKEAGNGHEALRVLEGFNPDFILTDLLMPDMDGFGLVEALKKPDSPHKDIPVIVLSADVQDASRERTAELGVACFLNKPVRKDMVAAVLTDLTASATTAG